MTPELEDRVVSVEELRRLAELVDWTDHYDWPTVGQALERSVFGVVAAEGTSLLGCARVVGDGVQYFYVQDVLVDPAHAEEGVATAMVEHLLDRIATTAPADAFVGLFSSPDARGVYEGVGFHVPDDMIGMQRTVEARSRP